MKGLSFLTLKNEFNKLAKLSCLSFSDEEEKILVSDMKSMISFADELDDYLAFNETCEFSLVAERQDTKKESFPASEILKNAPTVEDGHFKLPDKA